MNKSKEKKLRGRIRNNINNNVFNQGNWIQFQVSSVYSLSFSLVYIIPCCHRLTAWVYNKKNFKQENINQN